MRERRGLFAGIKVLRIEHEKDTFINRLVEKCQKNTPTSDAATLSFSLPLETRKEQKRDEEDAVCANDYKGNRVAGSLIEFIANRIHLHHSELFSSLGGMEYVKNEGGAWKRVRVPDLISRIMMWPSFYISLEKSFTKVDFLVKKLLERVIFYQQMEISR